MSTESTSLLVVDDEESNREGLARRLRRHGYTVTLAGSGREAIELLGGCRFVSAGHPGPVHLPWGSLPVVLEGSGFPVGVGTANYREQVVKRQPGDRLVLYSSGVTEARNADGEHFGISRLLSTLEQNRNAPLGERLSALLENVEGWRGNTPRHGDIAILAAEMAAPEVPAGRRAAEPV
jgi:hypothetical protein